MLSILLLITTLQAQPAPAEASVRKIVQDYVAAREIQDPKAVEALFTADADQLVSDGTWRRGRDAIVKGTLASSQRSGGHRTITVESVRFLSPNIAVADGRYELTGGTSNRQMWTSIWVVKQRGKWKISAIRNMLPAGPP
jgi:uncharacterized protein (TIGR02246 family)